MKSPSVPLPSKALSATEGQSQIIDHKSQIPADESFLTKEEVALRARVTVRCIERWMARGILPYLKFGNRVRFVPSAVEAALAAFYSGGPATKGTPKPVFFNAKKSDKSDISNLNRVTKK